MSKKSAAAQADALAELKAELQRARDQALRALAELENSRKRAEKARAEAQKYGACALATDILSIADNLQRALDAGASASASLPSLLEGVRATERELQNVFRRHQIDTINPKGEMFDPHCHEALYEVESHEPPGTVLEVAACGYRMAERLLRPARVGVAKAPSGEGSVSERDAPSSRLPAAGSPTASPDSAKASDDKPDEKSGEKPEEKPGEKSGDKPQSP